MTLVATQELSELAEVFGLELVLLFGSSLTHPDPRDVDLAILGAGPLPAALPARLCHLFGRGDLDVAWLDTASWLLTWEACRAGRVLFEASPGEFVRYRNASYLRWMEGKAVWGRRDREYIRAALANGHLVNRELVLRKCAQLTQHLQQLQETLPESPDAFLESHILQHACERLLELLVEDAAAVNTEVAAAVAGVPASDYYSSFFALADAGWVDRPTAIALAPYATLRNTLVHRYERVDAADLYSQLVASLEAWRAYVRQVSQKL